jgi:drug/metabolite transporter (DMT)-like permease
MSSTAPATAAPTDAERAVAPDQHRASYALVGVLLGVGGVMLFSMRPALIKLAYAYVTDPITLLALRMGFSLPFFIAIAWWIQRREPAKALTRRDWWDISFLGFLAYYAASFLDFLGLQFVSASVGRLIMFLYPTLVVLLSWLWLKRPPGGRQLVALAISYAGIVLVFYERLSGEHAAFFLGAALVFAAAASYAVYLVMGTEVIKRIGTMRFTAYSMIVASIICLLQFVLLRPMSALDLPMPVYWCAIIMAVGSTVIPIFMTSESLKRIGANRFAVMGMLGPITTITFGYLGLEERLTLLQGVGAVAVMIGVLIVTLKPKKE